MIRIGEIVKGDKNRLMNVGSGYERAIRDLSVFNFDSTEKKLLACLVVSQTEKQYKNYLIKVMLGFGIQSTEELVNDWQNSNLMVDQSPLYFLLTDSEKRVIDGLEMESHLNGLVKDNPQLFDDGLSNVFYPNKKLGMLYLRRLVKQRLRRPEKLDDLEKIVVHFVMAQLLLSWESSCIHLGLMLLDNWKIKDIDKWFTTIWPIYYEG